MTKVLPRRFRTELTTLEQRRRSLFNNLQYSKPLLQNSPPRQRKIAEDFLKDLSLPTSKTEKSITALLQNSRLQQRKIAEDFWKDLSLPINKRVKTIQALQRQILLKTIKPRSRHGGNSGKRRKRIQSLKRRRQILLRHSNRFLKRRPTLLDTINLLRPHIKIRDLAIQP